jgi:hypothetical protein
MKRFLISLSMLMPVFPVLAVESVPRDVQKFIDRREGCDHMRGEIPDPAEKQRMKEVARELRKQCTGTDKKLTQLKQKYAANSKIIKILNEFEPDVEASVPTAKEMHAFEK